MHGADIWSIRYFLPSYEWLYQPALEQRPPPRLKEKKRFLVLAISHAVPEDYAFTPDGTVPSGPNSGTSNRVN